MTWSMLPYQGHAQEFDPEKQEVSGGNSNDREPGVVRNVLKSVGSLAGSLGDCHVAINASGSVGPNAGGLGDLVQVRIDSIAEPSPITQEQQVAEDKRRAAGAQLQEEAGL